MVSKDENKVIVDDQIERFLDEFMLDMYKGHDHIIARKYFRELFHELIPRYFCLDKQNRNKIDITGQ